ncbi:NUDIX hydrolase [Deinococcus ruber]|uniref:Nudix hydrolase n=1 Tax=Deinococcus ruber TaxID=1848197 RepID=A0A918CJ38_9DEIO|nr:NUDIX hydrolase [Deinococcus ruber]GGR24973.1 nudix hydrolase [Deinococcus ruber]
MSADERIDLLDDAGTVIGTAWRSQVGEHRNIRSVNGFLRNSVGDLFIPKRTAHKSHFPSALDFSVGGVVQAGEHFDDAFRREAQEELLLDVDALGFQMLAEFSPHGTGLSSFMRVYEIQTDDTPHLNPDDFSGGEWLSPAALLLRLKHGQAAKGDLRPVVERLYPRPVSS